MKLIKIYKGRLFHDNSEILASEAVSDENAKKFIDVLIKEGHAKKVEHVLVDTYILNWGGDTITVEISNEEKDPVQHLYWDVINQVL